MVLLKYVFKNLGRKKKQTFFCVLCILISSFIVFADLAMINGINNGLRRGINDVISGQLTVYRSNYQQINILESQLNKQEPFEWTQDQTKQVNGVPVDCRQNRRLRMGSLVSFEDETSYINFQALEKDHLERINNMLTMQSGRMAETAKEIVISESMADNLHCMVGDTILLVAGNIHDYMTDEIGIVSGIFEEKGLAVYLGYNGFMPYASGLEIAGVENGQCLELILNPTDNKDFTKEEIQAIMRYFKKNYPHLTLASWEQTVPLMYAITQVWGGGGIITQVLFTLFSLIILITLVSLVVYSRRKEFGTLLAIGFSWKKVKALVCVEYAIITVASVTAASLLLLLFINLLPETGVYIASTEMQSALMTENLRLIATTANYGFVLFLFTITTIASVLISIRKIQKNRITSLINE